MIGWRSITSCWRVTAYSRAGLRTFSRASGSVRYCRSGVATARLRLAARDGSKIRQTDEGPWPTLSLDQILKTPFPSYHKPPGAGPIVHRSGNEDDRRKAVELLEGLRERYPHVLAIGQELVLALEECHDPDRAEQLLNTLEKSFLNLDEEFLCRWGRLFKDRGDEYARCPGRSSICVPPTRCWPRRFIASRWQNTTRLTGSGSAITRASTRQRCS